MPPDTPPEAAERALTQHRFLAQRLSALTKFQRDFEYKWHLNRRGMLRPTGWWDQLRGTSFTQRLKKRLATEISMAGRLERMLMGMEPRFRELRLLEYQRLDFMNPAERKIYLRNQLSLKKEETIDPVEPWKKMLGWSFVVFANLFMGLYIVLFGMNHGPKTTNTWLLSFIGAVFQDPLLNVPLVRHMDL